MTGYREFYIKYVLRKNQNVGVEHDRHGFRVRLTEDNDKRSTLLIYIKSHKWLSSCCQDKKKYFVLFETGRHTKSSQNIKVYDKEFRWSNIYDYVIRGLMNTKLENNFLFRECLSVFCIRNDGAEVRLKYGSDWIIISIMTW